MPRVSPLITSYINYLKVERGLSSNTTDNYQRDLVMLQRWATEQRLILRGLSGRDIDRYLGELNRRSLNPSTINRSLSSIRTFYDFLVLENEIPTNPTFDIPSLKQTRSLPHVLTSNEIERLLAAPDTATETGLRDRALLGLLLAAGLRLSELIALRHSDVSIDRRILKCLGKGEKERQVPFTSDAADCLSKYLRSRALGLRSKKNAPIFTNQDSSLTRQFAWSIIKHYAQVAGIPAMTPHSLRHTFATSLLERGVPTRVAQQLLGHSSITTTEIYLHVTMAGLRRVYDIHHPRCVGVRS
jgi:integrase/recombinase XerD